MIEGQVYWEVQWKEGEYLGSEEIGVNVKETGAKTFETEGWLRGKLGEKEFQELKTEFKERKQQKQM